MHNSSNNIRLQMFSINYNNNVARMVAIIRVLQSPLLSIWLPVSMFLFFFLFVLFKTFCFKSTNKIEFPYDDVRP